MFQDFHATLASPILAILPLLAFAIFGCSGDHPGSRIGRTVPGDVFTDPGVRSLADAAGTGDVKEIDRLVAAGVDVNATGKQGMTPLVWAMAARNREGFLRLLERGADPNRQHPDIDLGGGSSVTSMAASSKIDSFFLKAALEHGANPNLVEPTGNRAQPEERTTPLHRAISSRRVENLDLLIRAGADLNHKGGHFGATPLVDAAAVNWYEGVYRLLEAGADYRIKTDAGTDLADLAVDEPIPYALETRRWKDKVLDFLEKKGADLAAARKKAEARGFRTKKWTEEEWKEKTPNKGWPIPKDE